MGLFPFDQEESEVPRGRASSRAGGVGGGGAGLQGACPDHAPLCHAFPPLRPVSWVVVGPVLCNDTVALFSLRGGCGGGFSGFTVRVKSL